MPREKDLSPGVEKFLQNHLVWDDHLCMPLRPGDDSYLPQLERCRKAGYDVVSLNIGFDAIPWENAVLTLASMRRWIKQHSDEYLLVETVADIERCRSEKKLGVMFDLEGGRAINDQLAMIQLYYDLGVRWMLFAYNLNNSLAGGCQDDNQGLTDFGREVVREMERVGMVICCSHVSYQTGREIMEMAESPVIYSHSNPRALADHYRNVPDDLIEACARTGGVFALNGIGDFLGTQDDLVGSLVEHIDYVVQKVGPDHVGIGTDYVFDRQELLDYVAENPQVFDPEKYSGDFAMLEPEQLPSVVEGLFRKGYSSADVGKIIGGNHLRVASQTWK